MKRVVLIGMVFFLSQAFAQSSGYTYEANESYKRQKTGSIMMIIGGSAAMVGGIIMTQGEADGAPIYGSILATGGFGINVLGIVNLVKATRYRRELREDAKRPLSAGDAPQSPSLQ